jgi:hypothetical protein
MTFRAKGPSSWLGILIDVGRAYAGYRIEDITKDFTEKINQCKEQSYGGKSSESPPKGSSISIGPDCKASYKWM